MKRIIPFLCLFVFASMAYASLTVNPSRVDIRIANNDSISSSFKVTNNYTGDVDVNIDIKDWNTYNGNGKLDVKSWFIIPENKIHIAKGETKEIGYTVKTNDTMKGSVSGQVTFSLKPPGNEGLEVKMSFPVYLIIYGTEKIDFKIVDINVVKDSASSLKVNFAVKNDGNIHVRPKGVFNLYNKKGEVVYTTLINESFPIYAETQRSGFGVNIYGINEYEPDTYTAEVIITASETTVSAKKKFKLKKDGTISQ